MQFICVLLLLSVQLSVGQSDVDALSELKKGILSDTSWKVLASWDSKSLASDGCPKDWYGISCSDGHVTSLALDDLGLTGEFSFLAVSKLQMLRNLSVSNNNLSGTITKDLGSLESLRSLDLSHNLFTGPLPTEFTSLKNLLVVNISLNSMEGEIPSGFAGMKLLEYLDFHANSFTGDVMSLLAQLGGTVYVDLSRNSFSGSLDLGIGNSDFISSIRHMNISYNNLTGELFPHDGIPYFDNLEVFDASDNRFVGDVPSFSFVVSLRVLRLHNNLLSGSLPQGLLLESSMILSELDLSYNQLEGPIDAISSVNLRNLNLSSNRLSGPLPVRIGHCAIIDFSNNMISGNLSRIQGWGNYVEIIDLSSNQLTGSLPNQTTQFLRLTSLRISNNSLEGDLPKILGTYPELQMVDVSLNKLSGLLLPSFFNSTKLTDINLSSNNFSGTIPTDAAAPQDFSLVSLNLSHNSLTGELPREMGRFLRMVLLDLSNNFLEGGIPDDLPATMLLLNVSYNNFSGTVPQSLQRFPSSSFHPGNYLLVFPNEEPSTRGSSNLDRRNLDSHKKREMMAALIATIVGVVLVVTILTFLIYFKVHHHQDGHNPTSVGTGGEKVLPPRTMEFENEPVENSSAIRSPKDLDHLESARKTTTPITTKASTINASSAKLNHQHENPNSLKVCAPGELAGDLHVFDTSLKLTPEELSSAPAEAVGMSCHGTLYRAVLSTGYVLAVKLLKEGLAKGRKDFFREARKLGNIRHPNLVSLQGFYWGPKEHEKLIISTFISAPCLALYLHGSDPGKLPPLSLHERFKVALDVACCLTYLHTESAIPHGNLKSTNILIETPDVHALLTDYSLHRLLTSAGTAEQVLNAGALGYLPPEFTSTSKPCPSLKSDVYAFGVILLELLTGRSSANIVPGNPQVVDLSEWVSSMAAENRAMDCIDTQIIGTHGCTVGPVKGIESMLQIALKCILSAAERPDMKMVFEELSFIVL